MSKCWNAVRLKSCEAIHFRIPIITAALVQLDSYYQTGKFPFQTRNKVLWPPKSHAIAFKSNTCNCQDKSESNKYAVSIDWLKNICLEVILFSWHSIPARGLHPITYSSIHGSAFQNLPTKTFIAHFIHFLKILTNITDWLNKMIN